MNLIKKAIFAGSFDPIHKGHLDVMKRAARDFDLLFLVIANNENKLNQNSLEVRFNKLIKIKVPNNVVIIILPNNYLKIFAMNNNIKYLVRGYRNNIDYIYEKKMKKKNKPLKTKLYKSIDAYKEINSSSLK